MQDFILSTSNIQRQLDIYYIKAFKYLWSSIQI